MSDTEAVLDRSPVRRRRDIGSAGTAARALVGSTALLIAAVRGYGGCETLAIPNLLTGRRDHVGCVLFAPVDATETRITRRHA